jgi:hypothetical protein
MPNRSNSTGSASRAADGSCQLEATMAGWYGLFAWIVVVIAVLALLR